MPPGNPVSWGGVAKFEHTEDVQALEVVDDEPPRDLLRPPGSEDWRFWPRSHVPPDLCGSSIGSRICFSFP